MIAPYTKKSLAISDSTKAMDIIFREIRNVESSVDVVKNDVAKLNTELEKISQRVNFAIEDVRANIPDLDKILESIKGKDGIQGVRGEKGERGDQGISGKNGINGKDGKNGLNGLDGRDGKDGERGLPGKDGKNAIVDLKPLREEIMELFKELKEKSESSRNHRPFFGTGRTKVLLLDLSAQLNGSTRTFTVGTHLGITGVWGSSFPFQFRPTIDYTEVGRDIVFNAAINPAISLATGQTLIVQYLR